MPLYKYITLNRTIILLGNNFIDIKIIYYIIHKQYKSKIQGLCNMKILRNKGFRAIILTKRKIILIICISLLIATGIFLAARKKSALPAQNQYTSSDDFHSMIISDTLPSDKPCESGIKKLLSAIIGFDLKKPETILYDNSSQFYDIKEYVNQSEVVYPTPTTAPTPEPTPPQEEKPIAEIQAAKGMAVTNSTSISVNTAELLAEPLGYTLSGNEPQILIVHTHTTESYTDSGKTKYTASDSDRSTDETKNMTAVGKALAETLTQKGISVIHDTTVHDYPAYNGSYNRSKATVLANLEKYRSIKIVLDIHRDGIVRSDGTKVKVACEIDGAKASQCMFVVGTNALLQHDNWRENMRLACKLQNKANELYPNLMRPINLREQRFNQQLSTGALIIEVGSNGNTLDESVYSARLMGNVIAALFEK